MFRKLIPVMLLLALLVTACGLQVSLPITPGPTVTDEISIPLPDAAKPVNLTLAFGAGTLSLSPGSNALVSGTTTYNIPDFKPVVTVTGNSIRMAQGNYTLTSIPDFSNIKNEWELKLGAAPMDLSIEAGAYKADYEFGGLALTNLTVKDGAASVKLAFSAPNKSEMGMLRYETGHPDRRPGPVDRGRWPLERQRSRRVDQEWERLHPERVRPDADHHRRDRRR
ncbi:MAG: toast rack family protein [Anaerolineales bacterium]|nr:toast rack family protein [Anaerolineales bacterium]